MGDEATPQLGEGEGFTLINLTIQRMHAERIIIQIPSNATVNDLRVKIQEATEIPVDRQRIIYRGRVLRNGELLTTHGIGNESILHLVERPAENTSFDAPGGDVSGGRANVMFHAMEIDPTMGPLSIASQISQSIMGAFSGIIGNREANNSTTSSSNNSSSAATSRDTANPNPSAAPNFTPIGSQPVVNRVFPRPAIDNFVGGPTHQLVRIDTNRAIANINNEMTRVTNFTDGTELFPSPQTIPSSSSPSIASGTLELQKNFIVFENAYKMMSNACKELGEGLSNGQIPWDGMHNYLAMLHELPLLMLAQRRVLSTIRATRNGQPSSIDLPSFVDVPSFLDRPLSSTTNLGETHDANPTPSTTGTDI